MGLNETIDRASWSPGSPSIYDLNLGRMAQTFDLGQSVDRFLRQSTPCGQTCG